MDLIPTQEQIVALLRRTGALRDGHFEYANGVHTNQHVDPVLAMRSYETARILAVALSRKLRKKPELRSLIEEAAIVAATPNGMAIAYMLSYVLQPRRVYWVEKGTRNAPMTFRAFVEPEPGEKTILVDDILRAGVLLAEAKALIERCGAEVVAIAVLAELPTPKTIAFDPVQVYSAVELEPQSYDARDCELCRGGVSLTSIGREWKPGEHFAGAVTV